MPLLEARKACKPFEYPRAFEFPKRRQQAHRLPDAGATGYALRSPGMMRTALGLFLGGFAGTLVAVGAAA